MIVQGQCQHCAGIYEYEAGSKTEFCPHCGKETFCKPAQQRFTAPASPPRQQSTAIRGRVRIVALIAFLLAAAFFALAVGSLFDAGNNSTKDQQIAEAKTNADQIEAQYLDAMRAWEKSPSSSGLYFTYTNLLDKSAEARLKFMSLSASKKVEEEQRVEQSNAEFLIFGAIGTCPSFIC